MAPAVPGLVAALEAATVEDAIVPLVANSSVEALSDSQAIRRELAEQVARPVRWHQSVSLMAAAGVTRFIEFGPGKVLTGLVRRIAPDAALLNVSRLEDTQRDASLAGTS
jgi:[acyl-carrier-protein] S-malonyltransferase